MVCTTSDRLIKLRDVIAKHMGRIQRCNFFYHGRLWFTTYKDFAVNMSQLKTVLVFGGSGTVGEGAIMALLEKGEHVVYTCRMWGAIEAYRSSCLPPAYRVVAVFRDAKSADIAKSRLGNPSESTFAPVIGTLGRGLGEAAQGKGGPGGDAVRGKGGPGGDAARGGDNVHVARSWAKCQNNFPSGLFFLLPESLLSIIYINQCESQMGCIFANVPLPTPPSPFHQCSLNRFTSQPSTRDPPPKCGIYIP